MSEFQEEVFSSDGDDDFDHIPNPSTFSQRQPDFHRAIAKMKEMAFSDEDLDSVLSPIGSPMEGALFSGGNQKFLELKKKLEEDQARSKSKEDDEDFLSSAQNAINLSSLMETTRSELRGQSRLSVSSNTSKIEMHPKFNELYKQIKERDHKILDLETKLNELERQNIDLQDTVNMRDKLISSKNEAVSVVHLKYQKELESKDEELRKTQGTMVELERNLSIIQDQFLISKNTLENEIKNSKKRIEEMSDKTKTLEAKIDVFHEEIRRLEVEKESYFEKCSQKDEVILASENKIQELLKSIERHETTNKKLKSQFQSKLKNIKEKLMAENSEEVKRLENRVAELEEEKGNFLLQSMESENSENKNEIITELQSQISQLEENFENERQNYIAQLEEAKNTGVQLQSIINLMTAQKEEFESETKALLSSKTELIEESDKKNSELRALVESNELTIKKLKAQFQAKLKSIKEKGMVENADKIKMLENRISELEDEKGNFLLQKLEEDVIAQPQAASVLFSQSNPSSDLFPIIATENLYEQNMTFVQENRNDNEVEELRNRIVELQNQEKNLIQEHGEKVRILEEEFGNYRSSIESSLISYEGRIAELEEQIENKDQVNVSSTENRNENDLEREVKNLEEAATQTEMDENEMESISKLEYESLNERCSALEAGALEINDKNKSMEEELVRINESKDEIATLAAELKRENAHYQSRLDEIINDQNVAMEYHTTQFRASLDSTVGAYEAQLQAQALKNEEEINELKERHKFEIDELTTKLNSERNGELNHSNELEEVTTKLRNDIDELTTKFQREKEEITTKLQNEVEVLTANLHEKDEVTTKLRSEIEELKTKFQNEVEVLTTNLYQKDEFTTKLRNEIEELTRNLQTERNEVTTKFQNQIEELTKNLHEKDGVTTNLLSQLQELTKNLHEKDEVTTNLRSQLEELTENLHEKDEVTTKLQTEIEALTLKLQIELEELTMKFVSEKNKLASELEGHKGELGKLYQEKEELIKKLHEEFKKEKDELCSFYENEKLKLVSEKSELEKEIWNLHDAKDEGYEEKISNIETEHKKEVEGLKDQIQNYISNCSNLEAKVDDLESQLNEIQSKYDAIFSEASSYKIKIDELEAEKNQTSHSDNSAFSAEEINRLEQLLGEKDDKLCELERVLNEKSGELEALKWENRGLLESYNEISELRSSQSENFQQNEEELEAKNMLKKAEETISQIEKNLRDINEKNESEKNNLLADLSNAYMKIEHLSAELAEIETEYQVLENKCKENEKTMTNVSQMLENSQKELHAAVENSKRDKESLNEQIKGLWERLEAVNYAKNSVDSEFESYRASTSVLISEKDQILAHLQSQVQKLKNPQIESKNEDFSYNEQIVKDEKNENLEVIPSTASLFGAPKKSPSLASAVSSFLDWEDKTDGKKTKNDWWSVLTGADDSSSTLKEVMEEKIVRKSPFLTHMDSETQVDGSFLENNSIFSPLPSVQNENIVKSSVNFENSSEINTNIPVENADAKFNELEILAAELQIELDDARSSNSENLALISSLNYEKNSLDAQIEGLKNLNEELKDKLRRVENEKTELEQMYLNKSYNEKSEISEKNEGIENSDQSEIIKKLTGEAHELKLRNGKLLQRFKQLKEKYDALLKENEKLKSRSEFSLDSTFTDVFNEQLRERDEKLELNSKLIFDLSSEKEKLGSKVELLERAQERLVEMKESQESLIRSLQQEIAGLRWKIEELESERNSGENTEKDESYEKVDKSEKVGANSSEVDILKKRNSVLCQEIQKLEEDNAVLRQLTQNSDNFKFSERNESNYPNPTNEKIEDFISKKDNVSLFNVPQNQANASNIPQNQDFAINFPINQEYASNLLQNQEFASNIPRNEENASNLAKNQAFDNNVPVNEEDYRIKMSKLEEELRKEVVEKGVLERKIDLLQSKILEIEQSEMKCFEESLELKSWMRKLEVDHQKSQAELEQVYASVTDADVNNVKVKTLQSEVMRLVESLQDRDIRCEQLTAEITRLLEERDKLQLQLSHALHQSLHEPQRGDEKNPENVFSSEKLNRKLAELEEVNYVMEMDLRREREARRLVQEQLFFSHSSRNLHKNWSNRSGNRSPSPPTSPSKYLAPPSPKTPTSVQYHPSQPPFQVQFHSTPLPSQNLNDEKNNQVPLSSPPSAQFSSFTIDETGVKNEPLDVVPPSSPLLQI